jgi:hypothetical protein
MSEQNTASKETAEIIKDLQSKPQIPIKGNTSDFLKRFSKNADGSKMEYDEEETEMYSEDVSEDVIGNDNEEKKPTIQMDKKKPGFVQKQIEENKKLKKELEKVKSEEVPKYTQRIEELEKLVEQSKSSEEEKHYQQQLNEINEQKADLEAQLSKQIQDLKSQVEFYDLSASEDFQSKYVVPLQNSYLEAKELLGDDEQLITIFNSAMRASAAAYSTQDEKIKREALQDRREAFKELTNSLDVYNQVRFVDAIKNYEKATEAHANALSDWQTTKSTITRKAKEKELETRSQYINTWRDSYKRQSDIINNEIDIPESIQSYMAEKGISYDTSRDDAIALSATQQSDEPASVDEMNRLIHQGRNYKKLQSLIKAQSEMIKEKDDYINKLKGASRLESSPKSSDSQRSKMSVSEGLAAKLSRFTPQGRLSVTA